MPLLGAGVGGLVGALSARKPRNLSDSLTTMPGMSSVRPIALTSRGVPLQGIASPDDSLGFMATTTELAACSTLSTAKLIKSFPLEGAVRRIRVGGARPFAPC